MSGTNGFTFIPIGTMSAAELPPRQTNRLRRISREIRERERLDVEKKRVWVEENLEALKGSVYEGSWEDLRPTFRREYIYDLCYSYLDFSVLIIYSWGNQVVPYTEELISRPFLDENSI